MQGFVRIALLQPLRWLYMNAPSCGGMGGHEGAGPAEICTRLTGVPAAHWVLAGAASCEDLIDRKVQSLATTLLVLVYLYMLLSAVWALQALLAQIICMPYRKCCASPPARRLPHPASPPDQ